MRVLGYSFERPEDASKAEQALSNRYGLRPTDAQVGDLAEDGWVLAVRAREDNLDGVRALLSELGGKELVDVDERWTSLAKSN